MADFKDSGCTTFYDNIMNTLKDLDVVILVNNVGTNIPKELTELSPQEIIDIINVNCVGMTVLSSLLIPKLLKRTFKSAIINLSSAAANVPLPYITLYSATKSYNTFISEGMALENPRLDILSVKPMFVESPLSKAKKGFFVPDRN